MAKLKPTARPAYGLSLDWYRVRYQLAALYLNRATCLADAHCRKASLHAEEALAVTRKLACLATGSIERLDASDEELMRLLCSTIEPSALLLFAGALTLVGPRPTRPREHSLERPDHGELTTLLCQEDRPDPYLLVGFVESQPELAPRVLYNLACFYARVEKPDVAVGWLEKAVTHTPIAERPALYEVIANDPTLETVKTIGDFLGARARGATRPQERRGD